MPPGKTRMHAVILAAGVGKRLRPFTDRHPKSLLKFGGKTLLRRHLEMLGSLGITSISVVIGHLEDQVRAEVGRASCSVPVRIIQNPDYKRGSALSLLCAAQAYRNAAALIMDADILFDRRMLIRLVDSAAENCLVVDDRLVDTGEEVKVVASPDGCVLELGKQVTGKGKTVGESVGIFKFSARAGQALAEALERAIKADADVEYELVINSLLGQFAVGYAAVGGLPWLEIDFPADVERARQEVWPVILANESSPSS